MGSKQPQVKAPAVTHLTETTRVLRAHFGRPALTTIEAYYKVYDLARRLIGDERSGDDLILEAKLHEATGVSVAELSQLAEHWPT